MPEAKRASLLLIGVDRYVLSACHRLGVDAVTVYGPYARDNGLQEIPDGGTAVFCDDHRNPEAVLTALHRAGLAGHRFDAVQTTDERALVTTALLGTALGCRTVDPGTAVLFRDKFLQKQRVRAAGVRTARTWLVEDIHLLDGDAPPLPFTPAVLKPVAGAGTELTSRVRDDAELVASARAYRRRRTPNRTFVAEEFMAGEEWTADGVVSDGEVVFYGLGEYGASCLSVIESGAPLRMRKFDPHAERWTYDLAGPVVHAALAALGARDGVFHMELFHDRGTGRIAFSECALRRGGALTQEEIHCKFNVDLGEAAVLCALGESPAPAVKVRPGTVGSSYLPSRAGVMLSCPTPEHLRQLPDVEFARIDVPPGTVLPDAFGATSQRIGQVMFTTASAGLLDQRVEQTRSWFLDRLRVMPHEVFTRQLRDWNRDAGETDYADVLYDPDGR
ncbi:acetyl-CoA carboxylase biotin carboxylase subunit family protein [Actinoplanes sp. NPDC051494]|uniref:acetyl-CoA carboxylase biotin carboxylase subunit family protein n=1 Tax=Actinoplanes sp. NPDC051494 TaxID=3363907 RepID=UPI0037B6C39B